MSISNLCTRLASPVFLALDFLGDPFLEFWLFIVDALLVVIVWWGLRLCFLLIDLDLTLWVVDFCLETGEWECDKDDREEDDDMGVAEWFLWFGCDLVSFLLVDLSL